MGKKGKEGKSCKKGRDCRDYRKDILIQEHDLEHEWTVQGSLVQYYGEIYAEAIYTRDILKTALEVVTAELDLEIRPDYENFGFTTKPSETALKNAIILQKSYQIAERKLHKANREVNILKEVVKSFEHKKHALANKVQLKVTGFHSEPRNLAADRVFKEERSRENKKAQKESLNKGVKK